MQKTRNWYLCTGYTSFQTHIILFCTSVLILKKTTDGGSGMVPLDHSLNLSSATIETKKKISIARILKYYFQSRNL